MIGFYCLLAGIVVGVVIGWAHALDHREHRDSREIDLPSAWQIRQWEKQRLVRAEGNRRLP